MSAQKKFVKLIKIGERKSIFENLVKWIEIDFEILKKLALPLPSDAVFEF